MKIINGLWHYPIPSIPPHGNLSLLHHDNAAHAHAFACFSPFCCCIHAFAHIFFHLAAGMLLHHCAFFLSFHCLPACCLPAATPATSTTTTCCTTYHTTLIVTPSLSHYFAFHTFFSHYYSLYTLKIETGCRIKGKGLLAWPTRHQPSLLPGPSHWRGGGLPLVLIPTPPLLPLPNPQFSLSLPIPHPLALPFDLP